jgi:hypothetical protein
MCLDEAVVAAAPIITAAGRNDEGDYNIHLVTRDYVSCQLLQEGLFNEHPIRIEQEMSAR